MANTCSTCDAPAGCGSHVLFPVVDANGRTERCVACLLTLLSRIRTSGDVTVFVARPTAIPQN